MRIITGLVLCLLALAAGARELHLTLAAAPPLAGVVSTRSAENLSLRVVDGREVAFARATGRDYELRAGGGFFWTQVEEVPANAESVRMTPRIMEDGGVEVTMAFSRKAGSRNESYRSTVIARPGEWVQLYGPLPSASRSTTVYSTQQVDGEALYLRVEY